MNIMQKNGGSPASSEFWPGLPSLLAATLGSGVGLIGLSVYSLPFLAGAIAADLQVRPIDVTAAASILVLVLVFTSPLAGRLADRHDATRIAIVSSAAFVLGLVAIGLLVRSVWQFYIAFGVLAVLGAGTGYAVYAQIVSSWFERARGLALGIMMSGPGLAAAILPFILPPVVNAYGWRAGYLALAALSFVAVPVSLLFLRLGKAIVPVATGDANAVGLSVREAVRTRQFWAIIVGSLLVSSTVIGTHLNLANILSEKQIAAETVAITYAVYGVATIAGRLAIGALVDRTHAGKVGFGLFLFTAVSMVLFEHATTPALLLCGAVALGMASGAEGDLCAYLVSRYFGMRSYAEIYGWTFSAIALGLAAGLAVANFLVRLSGSFDLWLNVAAVSCVSAALMFLTLGRYRFGGPAQSASD